jgi:hypothetical protein
MAHALRLLPSHDALTLNAFLLGLNGGPADVISNLGLLDIIWYEVER